MFASDNWETLVNNVREAYNASIAQDKDVLLKGEKKIPPPDSEAGEKTEGSGKAQRLSVEQVNKMTVWVLKKGLGLLLRGWSLPVKSTQE